MGFFQDIGKAVTRMLTPSQQQIDFVRAAGEIVAPIATSSITAGAASSIGAWPGAQPAAGNYAAAPGMMPPVQGAPTAPPPPVFPPDSGGMSTGQKVAIGAGAGLLLVGVLAATW